MAQTVKLWGSLGPIGLHGDLIEKAADGSLTVPIADADELCAAFGLSRFPPAEAAPAAEKPAEKVEAPAKVEEKVEEKPAVAEAAKDEVKPLVVEHPVMTPRRRGRGE